MSLLRRNGARPAAAAAIAALASAGTLQNFLIGRGTTVAEATVLAGAAVGLLAVTWGVLLRYGGGRIDMWLGAGRATRAWRLALAAVVTLYVAGYVGGVETAERDDIQIGAVRTLLEGDDPYRFMIGWGAQNSMMPTFLAAEVPFVVTGTLFLMPLLVLTIVLHRIAALTRSGTTALLVLVLYLAMPVTIRQSFPEGGEHMVLDLGVLAAFLCLERPVGRRGGWLVAAVVAIAAFMGSRGHLLAAAPVLLRLAVDRHGWKRALAVTLPAAVAWTVITVGFFLWDPAVFAPLQTRDFLQYYDGILPGTSAAVIGAMFAVGVWALTLPVDSQRPLASYLRLAAAILALPIAPIFLVAFLPGGDGMLHWYPTYLTTPALLLIVAASWPTILNEQVTAPILHGNRWAIPVGAGAAVAIGLIVSGGQSSGSATDRLLTSILANDARETGVLLGQGASVSAPLLLRGSRWNAGRMGTETPLVLASREGDARIVELLLAGGASPVHGRDRFALCGAATQGHREVARMLIEAGAALDPWCGKVRTRDVVRALERAGSVDLGRSGAYHSALRDRREE